MFIGQGSTLNDSSVEAAAHVCWAWSHSTSRELMGSMQTAPLQIDTCNKYEDTLAHMLFLGTTKIIDEQKINICLLCSVQTALTSLWRSRDSCQAGLSVRHLQSGGDYGCFHLSRSQSNSQIVNQSVSLLVICIVGYMSGLI